MMLMLSVLVTFTFREVSIAGHVGGAFGGLVLAVPLFYTRFGHGWQRWLAAAGVAAVPLGSLAAVEYFKVGPLKSEVEFQTVWSDVRQFHFAELRFSRDYAQGMLPLTPTERLRHPDAPEARLKAQELRKRAQPIAERLTAFGGLGDAVRDEWQAAQQYLAAAIGFYPVFERALDSAVQWTEQDEKELRRLFLELNNRRAELDRMVSGQR
jgi:hypothetical protein